MNDIPIAHPLQEELEHLFFDPPDPPEFPAKRLPYHNGRRWKMETQGRADRRERRNYRSRMSAYYAEDGMWIRLFHAYELQYLEACSKRSSLYDFLLDKATK